MSKRVLLTGAAGFVGAVLTNRLVAEGHEVHAILRAGSRRWRLDGLGDNLVLHEADLRHEQPIRSLVATIRPQVVYHLATHGAYSWQTDADGIIQSNILGTWNLLKALSHVDYEVFVNTASSSEYGVKEYAMRETDVLEPNSYYAVAKSAQTLLCQHVARAENRPITTLRLFSVYGPFEEFTRLVPTLIQQCLEGKDLNLVEPDTARDFVYVDDVVDAYLQTSKLTQLSAEIINIGTGVQSTIKQVVDLILQHTGTHVACHWSAMPARAWDSKTWVADCTKSARLLGWRPRTTLGEGLQRTIAWMRERGAPPP